MLHHLALFSQEIKDWIPAYAPACYRQGDYRKKWIPAFAGMTKEAGSPLDPEGYPAEMTK